MTALLERPTKSETKLSLMYREHKELLEHLAPEEKTRVICCAAKLINYFGRWQNWKKSLYPSQWVYQPLGDIRHDLLCEHSIHVIRDAIALLERLKFLTKRKNDRATNRRNGQDRTHQYFLYDERIELALEDLFSQSASETLAAPSFVTSETPSVTSESPSVTDERYTHIPALIPAPNSCSLSKKRERIDFVQELKEPREIPLNELKQELMNSCNETLEIPSQKENCNESQFSATPAPKCDETVQDEATCVKPLPKLKSDRASGFQSQEERDSFYQALLELGKSKGVRSPVGWASVIIKSIDNGDPCQYLVEYRQGLLVGGCEKQEWESAPGQPFPQFVNYLKTKLKQTRTTDEEAIAAAYRCLKDVNLARAEWELCKHSISRYQEDWENQKRLGVSNAYLPPELLSHRDVSVEELAGALASLQSGCVQLQGLAAEPVMQLKPAAVEDELEEPTGQVCLPLSEPVADLEPVAEPPSLRKLQEQFNLPLFTSLVRKLAPAWGYVISDGLVLPVASPPSLEHLQWLHQNPVTRAKVSRLIAAHPEWGVWIDEAGELQDF